MNTETTDSYTPIPLPLKKTNTDSYIPFPPKTTKNTYLIPKITLCHNYRCIEYEKGYKFTNPERLEDLYRHEFRNGELVKLK